MNNKEHICKCGKQFQTGKSLASHENSCQVYKNWKNKQLEIERIEKESKRLPNGMFNCENCGNEHDGSYGSGKFCNKKCKQSFIAKKRNEKRKLKHIEYKPRSDRFPAGTWVCPYCNLDLGSKAKRQKHIHDYHVNVDSQTGKTIPWNKGLSYETDDRVKNRQIH